MRRFLVVLMLLPSCVSAQNSQSYGTDLMVDFAQRHIEEQHLWGRHLWRQTDPATYGSRPPKKPADGPVPSAGLRADPVSGVDFARTLAAHAPADKRADVERLYRAMLTSFNGIERKLSLPANDLGAAMALAVTSSIQVLTGRPVSQSDFLATVRQMRSAIGSSSSVARASPAARRTLYEQSVIVGSSLASAYARAAESGNAQLRERFAPLARSTLKQATGAAPEQVSIGPNGLRIAQ